MAVLVANTNQTLSGGPITHTNCDLEPIHLPGFIQPFGFLLCLDEQTRRVVQASANTGELLGIAVENLLGHGLELLLSPTHLDKVESLWPTLTAATRLLGVRLDRVVGKPFYKLILHRHDGLLWVEGEAVRNATVSAFDLPALNLTLGRLLAADSTLDLCQGVAEQVRELTGFDRVAIYRFIDDGSGHVIAETRRSDLAPWLGLHYPATDIPQQSRDMFLKNWLRFISDVAYVPVPLVPALNPASGRPPDMTYALLRGVSPIHLEYLRNMGSAATMTISLIDEGQLWGMITCHHQTPRLVSYELRDLCQFLGKAASMLLRTKERQDEKANLQRIQLTQAQLLARVKWPATFAADLYRYRPTVADVFDCGGAAVCLDGDIVCLGQTPTTAEIIDLVAWLRLHNNQEVFATNSYAQLNPAGAALRITASGVLAMALDPAKGEYILWFRPEQAQTVTWAGRHEHSTNVVDGQVFLSPRQSFEAWKQTVEYTAAPWTSSERVAAQEIRRHLANVRLPASHELLAKSPTPAPQSLERNIEELDSFAYVAAHDLKEPLRGIHHYAMFLLEDYAERLDDEGVLKLEALVRLSQRMEDMIEGLLELARLGHLDVMMDETDLNEALADVLDLLQPRLEQTNTIVAVAGLLPTMFCNPVRIREVFNNLITNAMRYNERSEKQIHISLAPALARGPKGTGSPADFYVFAVQDNGIGIAPRYHDNIFELFKRLHSPEKYGGGTGAGLAIARKMVEKHGGELWVDSEVGEGATFLFSLSKHL